MYEVDNCESIKDIITLCGGGIPAINYATGILYAMHKMGKLIKTDNNVKILNKSCIFSASSGGIVPLLLIQYIILNKLHETRDDWFEYFVIETIEKLQPLLMAQFYLLSAIKSINIVAGYSKEIIRICNENVCKLITDVLPLEITNGKPLLFTNTMCAQIRYNYVIDSQFNDAPTVSSDFTHLNNINVVSQIVEILTTCCIVVSYSQLINGTLNDAAVLIDNNILELDSYINLSNIYYYTLNAYDEKTNNLYKEYTTYGFNNINERSMRIHNYRNINNLKEYVKKRNIGGRNIKFNLITFPNKYNPIRKYNNKIYNDLISNIFYQNDFQYFLTFLGIFNGDPRMLRLIFLIGAYEAMYVDNQTEEFANTLTDNILPIYKEVLNDPYNIYFKKDPLSILSRLLG